MTSENDASHAGDHGLIPKPHPPLPLPRAGMFATFEACARQGRRVDFVHVRTIYAHHSRANILATNAAARGRATSGLTGTA